MTTPVAALEVVDSHTEGQPTRVVVSGWPALAGQTMAERRACLAAQQDDLRRGVICEPRGHAAIVGALLTPPVEPGSLCGVVFFSDQGCLGMCGHGVIGVVQTLEHLGRIASGAVRLDTPAGTVGAILTADSGVAVRNLPIRVKTLNLRVDVPECGPVVGDVVGEGLCFFVTQLPDESLALSNVRRLTEITLRIRDALNAAGSPVDYVELLGPPTRADADARNFVLCPGDAYDRSPCGMGTSAVMAARHAHGQLPLGARWRQEGIAGGLFTGWLEREGDGLVPSIQGKAYVTAVSTLCFEPHDPFRSGLRR